MGDQLVTVSVAGWTQRFEQAAAIADAALKRIDSPLKIDGLQASLLPPRVTHTPWARPVQFYRARPKRRSGPLAMTRSPMATPATTPGKPLDDRAQMRWRDGYRVSRACQFDLVSSALGPDVDSSQDKMEPAASDPALTGPWEVAYAGPFEFWAVKNDVLVKADAQAAMKQAHARNLVAAAMSKL
jgi:hypothetical protein